MELVPLFLSFVIGLGVGLASTFLGLGGGVLIVPLLPLVASVSARGAIATSLLTVFLVSIQNVWNFGRKGLINWRTGILIGVFSSLCSYGAGRLTAYFSEAILYLIFAAVLLFLAWRTIHHSKRTPARVKSNNAGATDAFNDSHANTKNAPLFPAALVGGMTGLISGFTGIGGGVFIVPLLSIYGWVRQNQIVPTSVLTIAMTSGAGVLAFIGSQEIAAEGVSRSLLSYFSSEVHYDLAAALFLGGLVTSSLGQRFHGRLNPQKRDWLIGLLLLALAFRILYLFAIRI